MSQKKTYTAVYEHDSADDAWLVHIDGIDGCQTYGRSLRQAQARIREALAPDGVFLMMEPNASSDVAGNLDTDGALLYGVSTLYCMTQSLALGGAGLGAAWGRERANRLAAEAGFGRFEHLESISNRFSAFYLLTR